MIAIDKAGNDSADADEDPRPVRRVALIVLAGAVLGAPAAAGARATVDVMVVGKSRVLVPAKRGAAEAALRGVDGRRCALGRTTAAVGARRDGRRRSGSSTTAPARASARDAGSLYVRQIGPDRARGRDGWVYKVGRRSGSAGAADPGGPFGTGRRSAPASACCGSGA